MRKISLLAFPSPKSNPSEFYFWLTLVLRTALAPPGLSQTPLVRRTAHQGTA